MGVGQKFGFVYLLTAHWFPLVANLLLSENIESSYAVYPVTVSAVASLAMCTFLFLLGSTVTLRSDHDVLPGTPVGILSGLGRHYLRWGRTLLACGAFLLGLQTRWLGLNNYRYGGEAISEAGSATLYLVLLLTPAVIADLSYVLFSARREPPAWRSLVRLQDVLLAVALLLLANGTITTALGAVAIFGTVLPHAFRGLLFAKQRSFAPLKLLKLVLATLFAGVTLFAAWLAGESIKSSDASGETATAISTYSALVKDNAEFFRGYAYYLVERFSVYHYSFLLSENVPYWRLQNNESSVLAYPFTTFLFRLDLLSGERLGVSRPEISSVMQLNYQLLTEGPINEREGSSPGLLASSNYLLPKPFGPILSALYLIAIAHIVEVLFGGIRQIQLSWAGAVLLLAFLQGVLQSPLDFLMVIDDGAILIALLCTMGLVISRCTVTDPPT